MTLQQEWNDIKNFIVNFGENGAQCYCGTKWSDKKFLNLTLNM